MEQSTAIAVGKRIKVLRTSTTASEMLTVCKKLRERGIPIPGRMESTLKTANQNRHVSAEVFGELLGVHRSTVVRAEGGALGKKGRFPLDDEKLRWVSILAGTHLAYVNCDTDTKDPKQYDLECDEAMSQAADLYWEEETAEHEQLKIFFLKSGYSYEYTGHTSEFDFAEILGIPLPSGPHLITDSNGEQDPIYLNDEELESLLSKIQNTIAFECFCISRKRRGPHGND